MTANGCCGKPQQCTINDRLCPFMNHKRRTWRTNAALPTCAACGQGERSSRHLSIHPDSHRFAPDGGNGLSRMQL